MSHKKNKTTSPVQVKTEDKKPAVVQLEKSSTKLEKLKKKFPFLQSRVFLISAGIALFVLLTGVAGAVIWKNMKVTDPEQINTNEETKKIKKQAKEVDVVEEPLTLPRKLDGIIVATKDANIVPACVMIENAAFSGVRPQSGLSSASVVYEVIVEGGITRLMALYGGEQADPIGPVRSARDTYLEFASEYNCAYIHAGGSYTAIQAIPQLGIRDIDALRESKWFWRDSHKFAPHDLFTNSTNLYEAIAKGHSWTETPTYESWKFVDDNQLPSGDTANQVNILLGGAYNVTYDYNTERKFYERTNGGVSHIDSNTGKVLTVRNIIVQHVPAGTSIEGKDRINFNVTGEGVVEIFRNGILTKGIWKKVDRLDRTQFYTEDGKEIPLVRGNSWVEIAPEGYSTSWK